MTHLKNILITGSSGQIGTNLGLFLQQRGDRVWGVDRRQNTWTDRIETIQQDLGSLYQTFRGGIGGVAYPDKLDVVVHLAAHAKVHELVKYPARALENIIIAFNVLEFCRQNQLPLIFASSREVYGNLQHTLPATPESLADFTAAASPYSASKISGEAMVYAYARCYNIPYLVFRFSNVYGRFDNDIERMERVIPLFIHKISRGEPVTVYGRNKMLDFTYVDDCINGITTGIDRLVAGKVTNRTINLAYGQAHNLLQMTQYIGDALAVTPQITVEESLVGEVTQYVADLTRARTLLDYAPAVSLQEGIVRSVAWSKGWKVSS